jgi:hypothetical protein
MSASWSIEAVTRFRDILALVAGGQVRTAYEIAAHLQLPLSSTYQTVAEMERLSCLARDENGYLLVGVRPQQIALDALGFEVAVQRLPPLVRHLRDRTGDTAFMADLAEILTVGTVATGFNPGQPPLKPFQTYRFGRGAADPSQGGVFELALTAETPYGGYGPPVTMMALELAKSALAARPGSLIVGVARASGGFNDPHQTARKLVELKAFFDKSQSMSRDGA